MLAVNTRKRPFIVGLTGGIGSGKSAAAERFAALGATVIDTDVIAHELTASGGKAMAAIRAAFGEDVIGADGALDRGAMRTRVFADEPARKRLEAILHPMIRAESARRCEMAETPYVVLAVPLLVESGHWQERCDRVCVIDCPEDEQVRRVITRSGLDAAQVRAIMATQASRETRLAAADDVVDNSGDLHTLQRQIEALDALYRTLASV